MAEYLIDGQFREIEIKGNFDFGKSEFLSTPENDLCHKQSWYESGYAVFNLFSKTEFDDLKKGIQECLFKISKKSFILEEYHRHCEEGHYRIVQKTRDLFPCDFKFDTKVIVEKLGALLGLELTDIDPDTNKKLHIILRINRPNSTDYNPPHKDIYQQYDESGIVPKCVNFWIPICGVNKDSTLPLAVGSHLLSEDKIFRSFDGGFVNGKAYNVRSVLHWGGDVRLTLPQVNDQQVLVFSSHLVHGCAINHQKDTTRIALEFRLFPKFKI